MVLHLYVESTFDNIFERQDKQLSQSDLEIYNFKNPFKNFRRKVQQYPKF